MVALSRERSHAQMATRVDYEYQGCSDQTVYPHDPAQSTIKNKANPKNDSSAHEPRDDESISTPVSSDRRSDLQLRGRTPIYGSSTVPLPKLKRTTGDH